MARSEGTSNRESGFAASEREWDDAYDRAMQSRDWMTCEQLLDEREQADWWKERDRDADE